jgi:hypothetical protein
MRGKHRKPRGVRARLRAEAEEEARKAAARGGSYHRELRTNLIERGFKA